MATSDQHLHPAHSIGIDWSKPGRLSEQEKEAVVRWYSTQHGQGTLDDAKFVAFWLDQDDVVIKRYRRFVDTVAAGELTPLPGALIYLYFYTVMGWAGGARYELIGAFERGGTRAQALETMALAFNHAGPMGVSQIADECSQYLQRWKSDAVKSGDWPPGWQADPQAFASGLDFTTKGMTAAELASLRAWYQQNQGEVPNYILHLATWNPEGLKAFRARFEQPIKTLPKQIVPLYSFLTSVITGKSGALRRATYQARYYGVTKAQLLALLGRAMIYSGELGTDAAIDAIQPLLDDWP